jgi:uncharacterized protein (UPF0262 family)
MSAQDDNQEKSPDRLIEVKLDESVGVLPNPDAEHERRVAIYDLLEENSFSIIGKSAGPYILNLSIIDKRLILDVKDQAGQSQMIVGLALKAFRRIIKDYYIMCDSYFQAIKTSTPSQIETIDMARRGLHNEGTDLLLARLDGKMETDFNTARRLFTLICVLHWRG